MTDGKETETLHEEHTGLHDEHSAIVKGQKATRAVFIGSTMVLWLLTMFVIAALNKTNVQLREMQSNLDLITGVVSSISACEIQDPEGNVAYRISIGGTESGGDIEDEVESVGE
ncbi:MAG: hypothetical protein HOJ57_39825 [Lentisphaerae bacterium]|jgi:hypothetical protein|nr:hypothetical protein [Lentisphaerota bacterium]MBT4819771.1 hypothetical protein [Lentisphaerota bacterium]MBT5612154.1 hypothetical protein [Lentisphaerota bacterium]MBT7058747.1 hypothetical protein [Lentisphaerota bacterium]